MRTEELRLGHFWQEAIAITQNSVVFPSGLIESA